MGGPERPEGTGYGHRQPTSPASPPKPFSQQGRPWRDELKINYLFGFFKKMGVSQCDQNTS